MTKQLVTPNYNIPYVGGLCEKFNENTIGKTGIYPSAMASWNDNFGGGNHPGELPPAGVRVPVYFSLGNNPNGHVAGMLEDGRVASSTMPGYHTTAYIHKNLQDLVDVYARNNGGCKILGWSEYIGKVKVIEIGDDMALAPEDQALKDLALTYLDTPTGRVTGNNPDQLRITLDDLEQQKVANQDAQIFKQFVVTTGPWNQTGSLEALEVNLKGQGKPGQYAPYNGEQLFVKKKGEL